MFDTSASSPSPHEMRLSDKRYDPKSPLTSLVFGNQVHQIQLIKFNQNIMVSSSHDVNTEPTDGPKAKNIY